MAKKNFTGGIDSLFQGSPRDVKKEENPERENEITKYSRTTLILNTESYEKIKAIAYWERKQIKDLIISAINNIINSYDNQTIDKIMKAYNENT